MVHIGSFWNVFISQRRGAVSRPDDCGCRLFIRAERFARLVTLASVLIGAGRRGERLRVDDVVDQLQITDQEVRDLLRVGHRFG